MIFPYVCNQTSNLHAYMELLVYKASAGSGKTFTLAVEYIKLLILNPRAYRQILAVTFTNKAANEMRQRIHNLTGDNDTGYINTFHGFCVSILQEDSHAVGYPKSFLVLDNSDIDAMLQIIYDERGLTLRDMTFSHARDMIEMLKLKDFYIAKRITEEFLLSDDLLERTLAEFRRTQPFIAILNRAVQFAHEEMM